MAADSADASPSAQPPPAADASPSAQPPVPDASPRARSTPMAGTGVLSSTWLREKMEELDACDERVRALEAAELPALLNAAEISAQREEQVEALLDQWLPLSGLGEMLVAAAAADVTPARHRSASSSRASSRPPSAMSDGSVTTPAPRPFLSRGSGAPVAKPPPSRPPLSAAAQELASRMTPTPYSSRPLRMPANLTGTR